VFAVIAAIPGVLTGIITGLFHFNLIAAIVGGLLFFIVYPRFRKNRGGQVDALSYFLALCGGIGGGLACYFVGNLIRGT
jgi:hypothetical protein